MTFKKLPHENSNRQVVYNVSAKNLKNAEKVQIDLVTSNCVNKNNLNPDL